MNHLNLNKKIARRVTKLREEYYDRREDENRGLTYIGFARIAEPHADESNQSHLSRQLSLIEKERLPRGNQTFITDDMLRHISNVFHVDKAYVLYGNQKEREELIKKIYLMVVYNISFNGYLLPDFTWSKYNEYYDKEFGSAVDEVTDLLINVLKFYAPYSYHQRINRIEIFENYGSTKFDDNKFEFDKERIYLYYDEAVEIFWELIKDEVIESYSNKFYERHVSYKRFSKRVTRWINEEFRAIIEQSLDKLTQHHISNIGYEIDKELYEAFKYTSRNYAYFDLGVIFEYEEINEGILPDYEKSLIENIKLKTEEAVRKSDYQQKYWNVLREELTESLTIKEID